jgi:hypothetical protein
LGLHIFIYLFLYPAGHLGFTSVTFFDVLPFTQVILVFLGAEAIAVVVAAGVGVALTGLRNATPLAASATKFAALADAV